MVSVALQLPRVDVHTNLYSPVVVTLKVEVAEIVSYWSNAVKVTVLESAHEMGGPVLLFTSAGVPHPPLTNAWVSQEL